MTIILYLAISIMLFSILSVWFKRSRKHSNSLWQRQWDIQPHETDHALVFITMSSLLWPLFIPIVCIILIGKRTIDCWYRWMDK